MKKWLIKFSRFHTPYENDKMGLWCLQWKTHTTELLLLTQICTKSFIGWGFAPDPIGGAYSAPPDLLAGLGGAAAREGEQGNW